MSSPIAPGQAAGQPQGQRLSLDQALKLAMERIREGRLPEGEAVLRQILQVHPSHPEALHQLAIALFNQGRAAEGVEQLRKATQSNGMNALYHANLCEMARQAKMLDLALEAGKKAIALRPNYPEALNNLGIVHFERHDFDAAIACYRESLKQRDRYPQGWSNLANALHQKGEDEEALRCYDRAMKIDPKFIEALNNKATVLRDLHRHEEAVPLYRKALEQNPNYVDAINNLGIALKELGEYAEAIELFKRAIQLKPDFPDTYTFLGTTYIDRKRTDEAMAMVQQALRLAPRNPENQNLLARVYFEMDRVDDALKANDAALALKPTMHDAYNNRGNMLKEVGRMEEAEAAFRRALEIKPNLYGSYVNFAETVKMQLDDPIAQRLAGFAANIEAVPPRDRHFVRFAYGRVLDDNKKHEAAMEQFLDGCRIKRRMIRYDEQSALGLFDRIAKTFTPELIQKKQGGGDPSELPIFVLGMPRSGTTLVEQIIAAHPMVHGAGELAEMGSVVKSLMGPQRQPLPYPEVVPALGPQQLAQIGRSYVERLQAYAPQAQRITDKMPSNYYYVGLIHLALPNAKIIHTIRNPMDTGISCLTKLFTGDLNYSYDQREFARYYRKYHALMAHWRQVLPPGSFLDVVYEDVVADTEGQARRILEFLGLPWDPACLEFHSLDRPIKTASAMQVRQPIYKASVERWRRYGAQMNPLVEGLKDLA